LGKCFANIKFCVSVVFLHCAAAVEHTYVTVWGHQFTHFIAHLEAIGNAWDARH
jgi:hypothetical protein